MSVAFTRHHPACQSGLTVPRSFLWRLFFGGALIYYRRTPRSIVRFLPPRISVFPPSPSLLRPLMHTAPLGHSGHNLG